MRRPVPTHGTRRPTDKPLFTTTYSLIASSRFAEANVDLELNRPAKLITTNKVITLLEVTKSTVADLDETGLGAVRDPGSCI